MTITQNEQERDMMRPMTEAERLEYQQRSVKLVQDVKLFSKDPQEFARKQATGIVENLGKYIRGEKESFTSYFANSVKHHNLILENFWTKVTLEFGEIDIVDYPDEPRLKQFIFTEYGYALIERTDYDAEGNEFGVNYEGCKLPDYPAKIIGEIATGLAMS